MTNQEFKDESGYCFKKMLRLPLRDQGHREGVYLEKRENFEEISLDDGNREMTEKDSSGNR